MELSVIAPILNEEFFLPLYLQAVSKYADEILLLDGGSQDLSLSIIKDFQKKWSKPLRFWQKPQEGKPYSQDWQEGKRRNFLLEKARGKWVLALDVDEFLSDNFQVVWKKILADKEDYLVYGFSFVAFWSDIKTIRVNSTGDPYWEGPVYRLIRRDIASYSLHGNHSILLCNDRPVWRCSRKKILPAVTLFHYHYALGPKIKENDNRKEDLNYQQYGQKPDWNHQPSKYKIVTRKYSGQHPRVIRKYLERMECD